MNLVWGFEFLPALDPASGESIYPSLDDYTTVCHLKIVCLQ